MACCRTAPSHYLNQCWIIVNWTVWSKIQSNFNRNSSVGANPALAGIPLVTLSLKTKFFFFTKHVKFTSFSLNDPSIFPVKICTYATLLSYTISYFDQTAVKLSSTFGDIKAITCDSACRGHYGTSAWPRSMHEPSTHCDYSSMKRGSPAVRASRIYSNQALTPSWRRLTTENWNIFIKKMDVKM